MSWLGEFLCASSTSSKTTHIWLSYQPRQFSSYLALPPAWNVISIMLIRSSVTHRFVYFLCLDKTCFFGCFMHKFMTNLYVTEPCQSLKKLKTTNLITTSDYGAKSCDFLWENMISKHKKEILVLLGRSLCSSIPQMHARVVSEFCASASHLLSTGSHAWLVQLGNIHLSLWWIHKEMLSITERDVGRPWNLY